MFKHIHNEKALYKLDHYDKEHNPIYHSINNSFKDQIITNNGEKYEAHSVKGTDYEILNIKSTSIDESGNPIYEIDFNHTTFGYDLGDVTGNAIIDLAFILPIVSVVVVGGIIERALIEGAGH